MIDRLELVTGSLDRTTRVFELDFEMGLDGAAVQLVDASLNSLRLNEVSFVGLISIGDPSVVREWYRYELTGAFLSPMRIEGDAGDQPTVFGKIRSAETLAITYFANNPDPQVEPTITTTTFDFLNGTQFSRVVKGSTLAGDYDSDGEIDTNDYAIWSQQYGSTSSASDGNADGVIDAADYTVWRDAEQSAPLGTAVPEAAGAAMLVAAFGCCPAARRRRLLGAG